MKDSYQKIINFWMPDHIDRFVEQMGERIYDKCVIFISLVSIFVLITFSFGLLHLINNGLNDKAITQFSSFLLLLFALIFFKKSKYYLPPILFPFLVSMVHLPIKFYQHGMILSPTPIWFLTIPPIIFYFAGNLVGTICYLIYLTEYVITSFLIKSGSPVTEVEWVFIFSVMISSFVWISFVLSLNKTQGKWDSDLKNRVLQESYSAHLISLGEMSGAVAHEINNPLAIIKGNAQAVLKNLEELDEINQRKLEKILGNVERVTKIVSSLNSLSRPKPEEAFSGAHFKNSFNQYFNLVGERLKNQGIFLRYNQDDLEVVIPCRSDVLAQTLITLTSNSIYAIQGQDEPWIEIRVQTLPEKIRLYFIDSGSAIDKKIAARIFEPFFTTKPQGEGSGIGLSLIRNKLIGEGGIIRYDRTFKNTTFIIEFPIS